MTPWDQFIYHRQLVKERQTRWQRPVRSLQIRTGRNLYFFATNANGWLVTGHPLWSDLMVNQSFGRSTLSLLETTRP
jgi:hypothetical protein